MNRRAILMINGVPYAFHQGFIESETYSIGSDIQLPTAQDCPPVITPGFRTATISLMIPTGEWKNKLAYKTAKEVIRITQFMFAQRNNFLNENSDVASTEENSTQNLTNKQGNKLTIPFTKLEVPWEIQISCAYFGINIQLACCILSSFTVSSNPQSSTGESWQIGLTEYDISQIRGEPNTKTDKASSVSSEQTFLTVSKY